MLTDLQSLANSLGPGATFLLLVAIVTGAKGLWVFGYLYRAALRELEKEKELNAEWQRIALRGNAVAKDAIETAKTK